MRRAFLALVESGLRQPAGNDLLARKEIIHYLVQRSLEVLEPDDELLERGAHKLKSKALASRAVHPLCPDRAALDHYLASLVGFMNAFHVRAVATVFTR